MRTEDQIFLLTAVVAYIIVKGSASTYDLRKHTGFRFSSREISWVLKRLRAAHVVGYLGTEARRWVLLGGETLLRPLMGG